MVQTELHGLGVARVLAPGLLLALAVVIGGVALALAARDGAPPRHVLLGGLIATDLGIVVGVVVGVLTASTITDQLDIPVTEVSISIGGIIVAGLLGSAAVMIAMAVARATESTRHPRGARVVLAGGAAALAVAVVVAPLGIVDAAESTLARADRIESVDAQIAFQVPVGDEQLAQLTAVSGVAIAEPVPSAVVELRHRNRGYTTQLEAFLPNTRLGRFETPDGSPQQLPADGLLVPSSLARILDVEPGDDISVTLPGVGTFTMPMVAQTSDAIGNLLFTTIPSLRTAMGPLAGGFANGLFNVAAAKLAPDADSARIAREVTKSPVIATYVDVAADLDSFVGALPLLGVVSWTLLGIGAVIAVFGALVAAVAIAPGARPRDLVLELVLPGIVGSALGVAIGVGAADRLVDALDTPLVPLQPALDTTTVLLAVGIVVLVDALVATWWAWHRPATMDGHG